MKTKTIRQRIVSIALIGLTAAAPLISHAADDKKNEGWRIEQRQKWAAEIRGLGTEGNAKRDLRPVASQVDA